MKNTNNLFSNIKGDAFGGITAGIVALPSILMVFLLAGIMQIGLGFLGLGKYIKYIPYPVVNINAGGKTRLSGMIAGVLLLFILVLNF